MTPLKNIKVLDLSKVLAGPLCAQYLGELGAQVIKVEPTGSGDDTRSWFPQELGQSATFLSVNHNKRSLAVDLKSEEGRRIVHRLASEADVVLQGFGSRTAQKLGVDYDTLKPLNRKMIYCEVSGYGRDGPLGNEPGYDVMLQAFSGMISTMGEPEGKFARASFSPVDLGTGSFALSGILAALIERGQTGEGIYLDVSLLDTSMGLMSYMAQNYWRTGKIPKRMGTGHPAMCPYQAFDTADGYMMLGVGNDAQWSRFCGAADLRDYEKDPRFITNEVRVDNFHVTVELVQKRLKEKTTDEWLTIFKSAGVACSPINTLDKALNHEQVAQRELLVETDHPTLGKIKNIGLPVRFNQQPRKAWLAPPLLGEHSEQILQEAGFAPDEIARFKEQGIISSD